MQPAEKGQATETGDKQASAAGSEARATKRPAQAKAKTASAPRARSSE
jgi:hypothetical protein